MALGTSNITMTAIRNALTEGTLKLSELCLSTKINKWAKYKPVRGTFPYGDDGTYGLNLANNWAYLRPRGLAYEEGYCMGDFRGYKHEAIPPFKLGLFPGSSQLNTDSLTFTLDVNENDITVEDLLLEDWYFGVKVTYPNTSVVFRSTAYSLEQRASQPEAKSIRFDNLSEGTYTWEAYVTQSPSISGEVPDVKILLPAFSGYTINGQTSITLEPPQTITVNHSSINGTISCYNSSGWVKWTGLNRDASDYYFVIKNEAGSTLISDFVPAGDPETGLPPSGIPKVGDVGIAAPTGWGTKLYLHIYPAT